MPPAPRTVLEYLYRDADNNKAFGTFQLVGSMSDAEVAEVWTRLDGRERFVAEQLRMPPLQPQLTGDHGPTLADHGYHELTAIRPARPEELRGHKVTSNVRLFLSRLRGVERWDPGRSPWGQVPG